MFGRKKNHIKKIKCHLFWCNGSDFSVFDNFPGTVVNFCFMMFIHVLILIQVCKIFNCKVYLKILLSMCLIIFENELSSDQVTFTTALSKTHGISWYLQNSKFSSSQNMKDPFFSCLGRGCKYHISCLGKYMFFFW